MIWKPGIVWEKKLFKNFVIKNNKSWNLVQKIIEKQKIEIYHFRILRKVVLD